MMNFSNGCLEILDGIDVLLDKYCVKYVVLKNDFLKEKQYLLNTGNWGVLDCSGEYILLCRKET